jgi:hypothetical protein
VNYATWKLNFTNPNYGTGPEDKIGELGFGAEGAWASGQVEEGGTILGYVTEELDPAELTEWQFTNLTEAEALAFAKAIDSTATVLEDGRIAGAVEA